MNFLLNKESVANAQMDAHIASIKAAMEAQNKQQAMVAQQPKPKNFKEEYAIQKARKILHLESRLTDTDGLGLMESLNWAWIYCILTPSDTKGLISVKRIKNFMEGVVKPADPEKYAKLVAFFDFQREGTNEHKEHKHLKLWDAYLHNFRTVENAYMYSKNIAEAMDKIANKLDAPEDMDVVTRVKWLRIWMAVFKDTSFFWTDFNEKYQFQPYSVAEKYNKQFVLPETLIGMWNDSYSAFPDGEVSFEMMQAMLSLYTEDIQKLVRDFGELDENKHAYNKVEHLRNEVKKKMFPIYWATKPAYFCSKTGFNLFIPEEFQLAWKAELDRDSLTIEEVILPDPFNKFKKKKNTAYKAGITLVDGEEKIMRFTCKEELAMYKLLFKYFQAHPECRFGVQHKTLAEYGLLDQGIFEEKADFKELMVAWILDMGFARDEADINLVLAEKILGREAEMLEQYYKGEIDGYDIFKKLEFSSDSQAIACFSLASKLSVNDANKLPQALKRIRMFGEDNAILSDWIYLQIFKHLAENKPDKLPKGLARQYACLL